MLQELNTFEMNEIKGGGPVTQEEYCATLMMIIENNFMDWDYDFQMYALGIANEHCPN
ncbi:MAG: hypothetical protein K0B37_07080 [Bacteroidales bacterium]|nr:hypothetical protein [Bacteroidales bacterium]